MQLAVLAATFTTAIVFFPVVFLYGVSKYLFTALALGVVLALAASYLVAMTVVPLFCARFIKVAHGQGGHQETEVTVWQDSLQRFNHHYNRMLVQIRHGGRQGACASRGDAWSSSWPALCVSLALFRCSASLSSRAPIPDSSSSTLRLRQARGWR